jgi:hypothetical protein
MRVSLSDPSVPIPSAPEHPATVQSPSVGETAPSFAQVLRGVGREINSGEKTMRTAIESMRGGSDLSPLQLIALQAGVYRYSEVIDLASRLVDRATSGIKTVVQGSGQ